MVFAFQIALSIEMTLSVVHEELGNNGEDDNPGPDLIAGFIAAAVSPLILLCQPKLQRDVIRKIPRQGGRVFNLKDPRTGRIL